MPETEIGKGKPVFAIASGKGGTGKTFLAVNLAIVAEEETVLVDADAEEPNGHLFLHPAWVDEQPVTVPIPKVDPAKCDLCGACCAACRFNALIVMGGKVLLFEELCHSCGACHHACPTGAITEIARPVGVVKRGQRGSVSYIQGLVNVGESRTPPVIEAARSLAPRDRQIIIDAPPGTTCPAVEAVKGVDYVVLVTEPTPFGLNDLRLAVEMCRALSLRCGVIVNRAGLGGAETAAYCHDEGLLVLAEIPFSREIAEAVSDGKVVVEVFPDVRSVFLNTLSSILGEVGK